MRDVYGFDLPEQERDLGMCDSCGDEGGHRTRITLHETPMWLCQRCLQRRVAA